MRRRVLIVCLALLALGLATGAAAATPPKNSLTTQFPLGHQKLCCAKPSSRRGGTGSGARTAHPGRARPASAPASSTQRASHTPGVNLIALLIGGGVVLALLTLLGLRELRDRDAAAAARPAAPEAAATAQPHAPNAAPAAQPAVPAAAVPAAGDDPDEPDEPETTVLGAADAHDALDNGRPEHALDNGQPKHALDDAHPGVFAGAAEADEVDDEPEPVVDEAAEAHHREEANTTSPEDDDPLMALTRELLDRTTSPDFAAALPGSSDADADADADPDTDTAYQLGLFLYSRGYPEGAETAWRQAAGAGHAKAATRLGMLLEQRGELDQAREAYDRAERSGDPAAAGLGAALRRPNGG
ncbi:MAG: hypothetical protein JOZ07_16055 [Solirubrobacterales bacterium]|nr:hypothetical protein [Solirubrobacterales bacterium]